MRLAGWLVPVMSSLHRYDDRVSSDHDLTIVDQLMYISTDKCMYDA